jgi:tetratricopeptide (TPR) repeat protein
LVARGDARARLFEHLVEVADLSGSDRVAAVWIDEYGPGLIHPHLVIDSISDRPRRGFSPEALHRAWERGVPGAYDQAADLDSSQAGVFAIALGSDGARGWFLVADSVSRRRRLDDAVRHRLMFLAGECSAILLHRDLDERVPISGEASFEGWRILRDLEGFESDEHRERLVQARFAVGRLVRMIVNEDLVLPDDQRAEQARVARADLTELDDTEDGPLLVRALDLFEGGVWSELLPVVLELGAAAERQDHGSGALELYECAFEIAAAFGDAHSAIHAARMSGRASRRRAEWEQADAWYERALEVARGAELEDLAARSLAGLGLVRRERGNLPAARGRLEEALSVAESAGDRETLASIHHDLMGLEQLSGDLEAALRHGWQAVNRYESAAGRTRCMAGLAGVLIEIGDLNAADDAYRLVLASSEEMYYRVYAYDGLALVGALRGDANGFDHWTRRSDEAGWESGPRAAKAEILCFRGLGCRSLGRIDDARAWLDRAIDFAEAHGFSRVLFRAEVGLASLTEPEDPVEEESVAAPAEVREGLRSMCHAAAGVES